MTLVLGLGFKTDGSARLLWKTVFSFHYGTNLPISESPKLKIAPGA
jgi:hypothetical protein